MDAPSNFESYIAISCQHGMTDIELMVVQWVIYCSFIKRFRLNDWLVKLELPLVSRFELENARMWGFVVPPGARAILF